MNQRKTILTLTAYSPPDALWTHFLQTEYDPLPISWAEEEMFYYNSKELHMRLKTKSLCHTSPIGFQQ